ncbi:hypothetical protein Sjap_002931 [Stephania japonica]|uniref:Uncharacterized protein n=1 Tax=Stephania japonica TaxID=461633 RepID=A0AAP0KMS3_9MAGN
MAEPAGSGRTGPSSSPLTRARAYALALFFFFFFFLFHGREGEGEGEEIGETIIVSLLTSELSSFPSHHHHRITITTITTVQQQQQQQQQQQHNNINHKLTSLLPTPLPRAPDLDLSISLLLPSLSRIRSRK